MLRVLPPTFKPALQQNQFVASCVTTDLWLDKITRESRHTQELRHFLQNANQVFLGPVKRATCKDFVAKSRTTLYFL